MKHIKTFEKIIDDKIFVKKKIYNILNIIGHEVNIADTIIKCKWKNNKIDSVYTDKLKNVYIKVSTILKNKNQVKTELIHSLSIPQLIEVFEYLKNNYPKEYERSLIVDDLEKYNI